MRSATCHLSISTVLADALFASAVQRSDEPSAAQIHQAIAAAVRTSGTRGCAAPGCAVLRRTPGDHGAADALGPGGGRRRVRRLSSSAGKHAA